MSAKLSEMIVQLYQRHLAVKRVTALTGGLRNVDSVIITAGGTGYTSAPTVGFSGGGGTGAAGTAIVANGVVVSVTITNSGSGYTSTPTVGFTGGGGSGAAGTAIMAPNTLDAIVTAGANGIPAGEMVAIPAFSGVAYIYRLESGTDAESSPTVIRPDDYATTTNEKVWKLQALTMNGMTFVAASSVTFGEGANMVLGTSTGTKIGTATTQKLGLFNVTPVVQPAHADQGAVTMTNVNGAIGGLTISAAYDQAEIQALRDATEVLADDVRLILTLLHALRTAGVNLGTWKGAA